MCAKSLQSCLTLCEPMDSSLLGSSVHGDYTGKNTGVGCEALLQEIFPTEGSNLHLLCLLHWQASSLPLAPPGCPQNIKLPSLLSSMMKSCAVWPRRESRDLSVERCPPVRHLAAVLVIQYTVPAVSQPHFTS